MIMRKKYNPNKYIYPRWAERFFNWHRNYKLAKGWRNEYLCHDNEVVLVSGVPTSGFVYCSQGTARQLERLMGTMPNGWLLQWYGSTHIKGIGWHHAFISMYEPNLMYTIFRDGRPYATQYVKNPAKYNPDRPPVKTKRVRTRDLECT